MTALLNAPVTVAGTFTGPTYQMRVPSGMAPALVAQETFIYGSGGTSVDVWVQTSLDGGGTWCDAIKFTQLLLASARLVGAAVQANVTPVAVSDALAGAAFANSIFGGWWRVKYTVVGTYAGGTTLRVDAFSNVGLVPAGVGA